MRLQHPSKFVIYIAINDYQRVKIKQGSMFEVMSIKLRVTLDSKLQKCCKESIERLSDILRVPGVQVYAQPGAFA